ncbi:hypothetical protein [Flammeovirga aprica]|uniref:Uncharacterized protein n=1 Tax=Flammeovirga aprica JL-4 TaxID=694437 RepID=A0A7X9XCP6_9BACT|nr:hypothetical protein [Flammeovirga aprica]NME72027.1 hypothetical protein [Flammeovirga aprica JL-4]
MKIFRVLYVLLVFITFNSWSQTIKDSVIFDTDGLKYKVFNQDSEQFDYFDIEGKKRVLSKIENDSTKEAQLLIMSKLVGRDLKIPSRYVREVSADDFHNTFIFEMTFLVEKNGEVSNLRLIGEIPEGFEPKDFFPRKFELPTFQPILNDNGDSVIVERKTEIWVTCPCAKKENE